MEIFTAALATEASRAPLHLVWLVALVLAVVRWPIHPRVSLIAVLAIGTMSIMSLATTCLYMWLPFKLRAAGMTLLEISRVTWFVSLASSLVYAACWSAIVIAMFAWRRPAVGS